MLHAGTRERGNAEARERWDRRKRLTSSKYGLTVRILTDVRICVSPQLHVKYGSHRPLSSAATRLFAETTLMHKYVYQNGGYILSSGGLRSPT